MDIDHEDLEGNIWVNEDEIPGNGVDDDNNGYVDDMHGWNFLGNADGTNLQYANLEMTGCSGSTYPSMPRRTKRT